MTENKVVHAAQRAAFSVAIDAAIKAVRGKGTEHMTEEAVKLINLAEPLLSKRYKASAFDAARKFVQDPNGKWMEYAYRAINEIDPHILKMNVLNLGLPTIGISRYAFTDGTYFSHTACIFAIAFGVAPIPKPQVPEQITAAS